MSTRGGLGARAGAAVGLAFGGGSVGEALGVGAADGAGSAGLACSSAGGGLGSTFDAHSWSASLDAAFAIHRSSATVRDPHAWVQRSPSPPSALTFAQAASQAFSVGATTVGVVLGRGCRRRGK